MPLPRPAILGFVCYRDNEKALSRPESEGPYNEYSFRYACEILPHA